MKPLFALVVLVVALLLACGCTGTATEEAFDWFNRVVTSGKVKRKIEIKPMKTSSRSYAGGTGTTLRIANGDPARTIVHELGHSLEELDQKVWSASRKFYAERTKKDKIESLAKLTGKRGYGSEKTKKDKFLHPYMGKWETDATGQQAYTELVSMGLEELYVDPVRLLEKDPEYFKWIVEVIHGVTA
ncbi:hypothetical protein [Methanoculleus sp.]|uniref:hypothetical protein n=1 Tax=Methanoculleus sp. TaxID=90427 RepID=UPI001BD52BE3|nr:hypothetical protein [Methanoculleus sp.]